MAWSIVGLCISLPIALLAWWRMRANAGFYDGEVYGMTARAHRRYLGTELLFCAVFVATLVLRVDWLAAWFLAFAVLVDVLYITSFARGALDEE